MGCDCINHIGEAQFNFNPGFKRVEYVHDGMRVIAAIPVTDDEGIKHSGIWCVVVVAAGHHARVANKKYGIDQWVHISTLCLPEEKP